MNKKRLRKAIQGERGNALESPSKHSGQVFVFIAVLVIIALAAFALTVK